LVSGASYAIRTFDLTGDPVMTITTGPNPQSPIVTGADGLAPCYPSSTSLGPACATFVASSTTPVWAHVRGWTINTRGETTVRIRRLTAPGVVPTDTIACSAATTTPTTTCWMAISAPMASFGGTVRVGLGTTATRMHFVTRETPHLFALPTHAPHALWFVRDNGDPADNWQLLSPRYMLPANGVGQTTSYIGPVPPGLTSGLTFAGVVAGAYGTDSDVVLQRNDFVPGSPAVGTDFDGDGLGANLEALLRTCDSPTTTAPSGFTCNLRGCTTSMTTPTAACKASLNDSDRDGIPDPIDLYGGISTVDSHLRLARMGTSPSQFDVLVEADVGWDDTFVQGGACTYTDLGAIDWREALQAANIYQNAGSFVLNRNGTQGIHLHTEIPSVAEGSILGLPAGPTPGYGDGSVLFPHQQDPRFHYGEQTTCVRHPACSPGWPDPCAGLTGGSCVVNPPRCLGNRTISCTTSADCPPLDTCVDPDDTCTVPNPRHYWMSQARRWLFRYHHSFAERAGQAGVGSLQGSSGDIEYPHELGHQGGLGHGGPTGDDSGNGRPNHYSHINYLFQNYGLVSTRPSPTNPMAPNALDLPRLAQISFANGTIPALDPFAVPEICPLGPAVSYQPLSDNIAVEDLRWNTGTNYNWSVTGPPGACPAVNWERDGSTYSDGAVPAGQTMTAPFWAAEQERTRRAAVSLLSDDPPAGSTTFPVALSIDQPADLVRRGGATLCAYRLLRYPTTGVALERSCNDLWACPNTPQSTNPRFPTCSLGVGPDTGTILLENSAQNPVLPNGAFAAETTTRGDGSQVVVVVWRVGASTLRAGVDAGGAWLSNVQTLSGTSIAPFATTAPSDGTQLLALSRIGDGQALSLVYRAQSGSLVEHTMTWSGTTPVWTTTPSTLPVPSGFTGSPGSVRLPSGTFTTSVGGSIAVDPGVILAVTRTPASGPPQLELWLRNVALPTGAWVPTGTSALVGRPESAFRGQPQLGISPVRRGSTTVNHLWTAAMTNASMTVRLLRSDPGVVQSAFGTRWLEMDGPRDWALAATPALLRDDRQPPGLRGIVPALRAEDECTVGQVPSGCLSDEVCTPLDTGRSICAIPGGRFVRVREYQSVGMDGLIPGMLESLNEWPQLQRTFCATIRGQRVHAPAPWTGETGDSCIDAPVY
jgi:hypothetical protein